MEMLSRRATRARQAGGGVAREQRVKRWPVDDRIGRIGRSARGASVKVRQSWVSMQAAGPRMFFLSWDMRMRNLTGAVAGLGAGTGLCLLALAFVDVRFCLLGRLLVWRSIGEYLTAVGVSGWQADL